MGRSLRAFKIIFLMIFLVFYVDLFSKNIQKAVYIQNQELSQTKVNVQAWFQKMIQKYPDLQDCAHVPFRPSYYGWSVHSCSNYKYIGYPPEKDFTGFTEDDEWALLHECGHIKNHAYSSIFHDKEKRFMLAKACVASGLLSLTGALISNIPDYVDMKHDIKISEHKVPIIYPAVVGLLWLNYWLYKKTKDKAATLVSLQIKKIDENWADQYACKHADKQALQGGYKFFMKHFEKCQNYHWYKPLFSKSYKKMPIWMIRWYRYFEHSHRLSIDRANEIKQMLYKRFGCEISKEVEQSFAV